MSAATGRPPSLEIDETHDHATTTLKLSGELDLASSIAVIEATRRALRRRPALLRLDLSEIEFLDISGARALIRCRRLAGAHEAGLELFDPSPPVQRLLDISRLRAVFDIQATPTTAAEDADADDA